VDFPDISQSALAQYDVDATSVSPVAQSGGAVFSVSDAQGRLYSLRVHVPRSSTLEETWTRSDVLDSELVWLDALCRDTDLVLPAPQRNRQGTYVTRVDGVNCTLLSWVPGKQKQYFTDEQELKSTAEMTAVLHRQASAWQPPASFVRPSHDAARVQRALGMLAQRAREGRLDARDVQILADAGDKAIAMLDILPRSSTTWGILHMDLLPSNIVYVEGRANPIDFGACGHGFFLNDLAATFCFVAPPARRQYIDWYAARFPLPENHVEQLEGLFIAARLTSMIHFLGLPGALDWLPGDVRKSASREFGSYARGESFLFSGTPFWE
jgi:Ser/Thr protein kinase RdoA (MazF antagonist)